MNKVYERITLMLIEAEKIIPGPGYTGPGHEETEKIIPGPGYISSRLTDKQREQLIAQVDIDIARIKAAKRKAKEKLNKEKKDK